MRIYTAIKLKQMHKVHIRDFLCVCVANVYKSEEVSPVVRKMLKSPVVGTVCRSVARSWSSTGLLTCRNVGGHGFMGAWAGEGGGRL